MPWVRLHATKAYYDMAFLLEHFPEARSTFNFTPSLLLQLEEFSAGRVRDLFLEHAQRPAADLTPTEKAFLIRHFFSANWATISAGMRRRSHNGAWNKRPFSPPVGPAPAPGPAAAQLGLSFPP